MEVLIRVATGLLIIIPGALIFHLYPNGTLFILLMVHLFVDNAAIVVERVFTLHCAYFCDEFQPKYFGT